MLTVQGKQWLISGFSAFHHKCVALLHFVFASPVPMQDAGINTVFDDSVALSWRQLLSRVYASEARSWDRDEGILAWKARVHHQLRHLSAGIREITTRQPTDASVKVRQRRLASSSPSFHAHYTTRYPLWRGLLLPLSQCPSMFPPYRVCSSGPCPHPF